jgi:hypothetical protein
MRRALLTLLVPAVLLTGSTFAEAASPRPQVSDRGGDALGTKSQDIRSVLFEAKGRGASKALVVTMSTWSPVMQDLATFNYEVDAKAPCGDVSFSFSPGTPYQSVTGLNGWVSTSCGAGLSDLVSVQVKGTEITWVLSLDPKAFEKGMPFTDFVGRIDLAQPAVPFASSATGTTLGLVDIATAKGPWRLT